MKTEMWIIGCVVPYDKNHRQNDASVAAVATSISEFGFRQPIVVDANGVIVVGHTRWKAALKLGLKQVPVHVAKDLTPAHARAYPSRTIKRPRSPLGTPNCCRWNWRS